MGISSKLDEGKIYRLIKTAIKMRSLQRQRGRIGVDEKEIHETEILFDAQLDGVLANIDEVDTDRVISAMSR